MLLFKPYSSLLSLIMISFAGINVKKSQPTLMAK